VDEGRPSLRRRRLIHARVVMLSAVLIAGCAAKSPAGPQSVDLSLVAPTDGAIVNVRSVTVLGHVEPASARVRPAGWIFPTAAGCSTRACTVDRAGPFRRARHRA
jgi:hypothetical protein